NSAFNDPLDFVISCHCVFSHSSSVATISLILQSHSVTPAAIAPLSAIPAPAIAFTDARINPY
ncbi:MAG: hypothetical protein WA720_05145, partial [Pseudolabrys sp.]